MKALLFISNTSAGFLSSLLSLMRVLMGICFTGLSRPMSLVLETLSQAQCFHVALQWGHANAFALGLFIHQN